jgi:predicted Zn-ribbon and HTH transcriptional regulator
VVPCDGQLHSERAQKRPAFEVADVFREHREAFESHHVLTSEQREVIQAIVNCRTAALDGHAKRCRHCGHVEVSYNSCRNRHCPKCQGISQARWIHQRQQRILPTHYFHLVFTIPAELRALALYNRRTLFDLLFKSASETLLELARDHKWLGATPAITAVLHTWTRKLELHPHLHVIVTGGGLTDDDSEWKDLGADFLFPVRVLGSLFRGKFLDGLRRAHRKGQLELDSIARLAEPGAFEQLVRTLYQKSWVVYAKRPFGGAEQVFEYLGRYTHRVAISNARLIEHDEGMVTFATKNGGTATLEGEEFMRRFLLHVLPKGFVKIRHYGLTAASNAKTRLETARSLVDTRDEQLSAHDNDPSSTSYDELSVEELMLLLTGEDLTLCPKCGRGPMERIALGVLAAEGTLLETMDSS